MYENLISYFDNNNTLAKKIIQKYGTDTCKTGTGIGIIYIFNCLNTCEFGYLITNPKLGEAGDNLNNYELYAFLFCVNKNIGKQIHITLGCVNSKYKKRCDCLFKKLLYDGIKKEIFIYSLDVDPENEKLITYYESLGFVKVFKHVDGISDTMTYMEAEFEEI